MSEGTGMEDAIIARLEREAGIPGLVDVLAGRLDPTDLQSLLLAVYRRRAAGAGAARLLDRYERDRFVRPSALAPALLMDVDRLAWSLLPAPYKAIELSPVCPLGTVAAVATVDQNNVVTTIRNTEVMADSTNALALECAARRRRLLRRDPRSRERVRLCASHRLVRGQAYRSANAQAHFRLLGLCAAGRDEGSFRFETTSLAEQIGFYLHLLREAARLGYRIERVRVAVTGLDEGRRERALVEHVLAPVQAGYPDVACALDPDRASGRVGHQARRRAKRKLHEPGRHLPGVDRLEPEPGRDRYHRQPGHLLRRHQDQVMELGGTERRPWQAGLGHGPLGGTLGPEVAEQRAVDAAGDGDPVGADDRDVHQVPRSGPRRCPDQVQGLLLVALVGAREVHVECSRPLWDGGRADVRGDCVQPAAPASSLSCPGRNSHPRKRCAHSVGLTPVFATVHQYEDERIEMCRCMLPRAITSPCQ